MMTPESFKDEMLQYVSESYEAFQRYQALAENTLDETVRVLVEAGIDYQLAWGSLLGAVRDGGQIPWDYDIDIFVRIDQREALARALKDGLSQGYYVDSLEFDSKCSHYIMRVAPRGYDSEHLHVDVFFLCGAPEKGKNAFVKSLYRICRIRYWKYVDVRTRAQGSAVKRKLFGLIQAVASVFPDSLLDARYRSLVFRCSLEDATTIVEADRFAGSYSFTRDILETGDLRLANGKVRRVPKRYENLLCEMYGDYDSYAPIATRFKEFMFHYNHLEAH